MCIGTNMNIELVVCWLVMKYQNQTLDQTTVQKYNDVIQNVKDDQYRAENM